MKNPTNLQSTHSAQTEPRFHPIRMAWISSRGLTWIDGLFCLLLLLGGAFYFSGLRTVPFHPDESTQIFMSADLDILLSHPDQILWNPEPNEALRQTYRELDAPLTRYLIGLGRRGGGFAELPSDWVWGKSWSANAQAGALPSNGLLLSARLAVAWLFPISLLLIYAGCRRVGHAWVGWIACMILAFHPLVLLHTRRAMAESALFFGAALIIAILPSLRIRPWMAGLAGALALNAKQSALGLLPAAALACTWVEGLRTMKPARIGFRLVEFLACLFLFTFLLNPYLWQDPISAASAAAAARADLFTRQSADFHVSPATNIAAIAQQVIVTLGQVYLAPPQFEEVGNYIADTAGQKAAYLANPLNDLLQSPIWGGLFLFFTLFGVILSFYRIRRLEPANQRWMILLALATVGEFLVLAVALPLPYQRYVIPLLPLLCIWAALGVEGMVRSLLTHRKENPTG